MVSVLVQLPAATVPEQRVVEPVLTVTVPVGVVPENCGVTV